MTRALRMRTPGEPTVDERRSARLLFSDELADGRISDHDLDAPEVRAAAAAPGVPGLPRRVRQALDHRGAADDWERFTAPAMRARRAVLGDAATAAPRILLRMDEYPHALAGREPAAYGDAAFAPWRDILGAHGCPQLVAVMARVADDPYRRRGSSRDLDDAEVARLHQLTRDGVTFGLHGHDHRNRVPVPHLHTELGHRTPRSVASLLDRARDVLRARTGISPRVLVPPFNTFGSRQWRPLAARFDVITGGPESVLRMGLHAGPSFHDGAVYLPVYSPLYGTAEQVLPAIERHLDAGTGLWTPIVLHWGWEKHEGWRALDRLVARIAPYAADWSDFLDTVEKSR